MKTISNKYDLQNTKMQEALVRDKQIRDKYMKQRYEDVAYQENWFGMRETEMWVRNHD